MHAVHDAAVAGKNDWEIQIAIEHQARVPDDFTTGHFVRRLMGPMWLVKLAYVGQRNSLANQAARLRDEAVHVPGAQTLGRSPEMVLRPHVALFSNRPRGHILQRRPRFLQGVAPPSQQRTFLIDKAGRRKG